MLDYYYLYTIIILVVSYFITTHPDKRNTSLFARKSATNVQISPIEWRVNDDNDASCIRT